MAEIARSWPIRASLAQIGKPIRKPKGSGPKRTFKATYLDSGASSAAKLMCPEGTDIFLSQTAKPLFFTAIS